MWTRISVHMPRLNIWQPVVPPSSCLQSGMLPESVPLVEDQPRIACGVVCGRIPPTESTPTRTRRWGGKRHVLSLSSAMSASHGGGTHTNEGTICPLLCTCIGTCPLPWTHATNWPCNCGSQIGFHAGQWRYVRCCYGTPSGTRVLFANKQSWWHRVKHCVTFNGVSSKPLRRMCRSCTGPVPYIGPWPAMVIRGIANTAAAGGPLGSVQPVGIGCT